ncbi:hypothetical protein WJX77_004799 [Trebouxia sp. C0004]
MPNVVPNTQTSAGQGPGRGARGSATGVIPARSQSTLPERFRRGPATPAADSGNSTSGSEEHEDIGATDPTSQPWFNDPDLPQHKKFKLQQGQVQVRLLSDLRDKVNELLPMLKHKNVQPGSARTAGRFSDKQLSKIKKDTVKAMQKVMNNSTFYPDSQQYDLVAMEVQGKPNVDKCKEDYDVFVVVHREAEIAARNYRSDSGKRINDAIKSVWWGEGEIYRKGGEEDYFGNEE